MLSQKTKHKPIGKAHEPSGQNPGFPVFLNRHAVLKLHCCVATTIETWHKHCPTNSLTIAERLGAVGWLRYNHDSHKDFPNFHPSRRFFTTNSKLTREWSLILLHNKTQMVPDTPSKFWGYLPNTREDIAV